MLYPVSWFLNGSAYGGYYTHEQPFKPRLTVSSQPASFQDTPQKLLILKPIHKTSKIRKSKVKVPQKAAKKTYKIQLDIIQLTTYVQE